MSLVASTAPLARSTLTSIVCQHLVTELTDAGILVGRGVAPKDGGWSGGQPGQSNFVSYVTVKTGVATILEADPVGRSRMSWKVAYTLTSTGALESHADDVADQVRAAMVTLGGPFDLRGVSWGLQQVQYPQLGATIRNDSTDPAFWEVSDGVSLWLSRTRGA